jgi:hypothetical protein
MGQIKNKEMSLRQSMTVASSHRVDLTTLILFVCVLFAWGCSSAPLPPPTAPFPPRDEVPVESYKFRVAVSDFTDQTERARNLVKTIPDILTTALFKSGRVDLYERDSLRGLSAQDTTSVIRDLMSRRMIDGVISGTITRVTGSKKTLVVEIRLLSRNKAVMYADNHTLTFRGRRAMEINRDDVISLAETISKAMPLAPDIKIVSKSGDRITLGGGENKGLIAGMMGYVQALIIKVRDPKTGEVPRPSYVIVGEVVIDQVTQDSATGRILTGEDIRPNDIVRFK